VIVRPLNLAESSSPEALRQFLGECRQQAAAVGRPQLVSISIAVPALDPLAVLESIFEPTERHFYVERPAEGVALAGAEAVLTFTADGATRFADCQRFIAQVLEHTIAVGCVELPFGGPHFFAALTFEPNSDCFEQPFAPATVFVPRWQVASRDGITVAVANLLIAADTPVEPAVQKVWRAHQKFSAFDYLQPKFPPAAATVIGTDEGDGGARPPGALADPKVDSARAQAALHASQEQVRYRAAVTQALAEIARGDYEKIVLARTRELRTDQAFHPLRVLNGLRQRFPDCYAFSVANGLGVSFIGASPERLIEVRGGRLRTEALAGSARRGSGASEDAAFAAALWRDEKERREHGMVVSFIAEQLRGLGLKPDHAAAPGLRRFANVQHLHTAIEADLPPEVRLLDVAERLFPTPAVGGSPRAAALSRIAPLEGFARGLYAGGLGWIDHRGDGELLVGLRSALIAGPAARLYAGAGIVAGSSPDRELAETELKFRAMHEALLA
jgi:menaquinone-specific isochorismate synthase